MKLILSFLIFVIVTLVSCSSTSENIPLLKEIIEIANEATYFVDINIVDNCHCTVTRIDGEVVDTIVRRMAFEELDSIKFVQTKPRCTSWHYYNNGKGLDIVKLTPLENHPIEEGLYEELESYNDVISFQHKNEIQAKKFIKKIKKIAKRCGAKLK